MPHLPLQHEDMRKKVCCVCLNEHGNKAKREINSSEAEIVNANWVPKFNVSNPLMPSGICVRCIFDISQFKDGIEVHPLLPDSYHCKGYHPPTRAVEGVVCGCTWCELGRKNGLEMRKFAAERKGKANKVRRRLCPECYRGVLDGHLHACDPKDSAKTRNLLNNIPEEVAANIAAAYIAEKLRSGEASSIALPHPSGLGGHPMVVTVGHQAAAEEKPSFNQQEIVSMTSETGVPQRAMYSFLANVRSKFGRNSVEPGIKTGFPLHNKQYEDYFAAKFEDFEGSNGEKIRMPFVHCTDLEGFINKVEENRGAKRGKKRKIGGDSGKGFLKLTLTLYDPGISFANCTMG